MKSLCRILIALTLCLGVGCQANSTPSPQPQTAPAAASQQEEWALRLVNATHPLPEDFTVETTSIPGYDNREFDSRAAQQLCQMLQAAEEDGHPLYLVSAYRSVQRQTALFERKTQFFKNQGMDTEAAQERASQVVARPGTSEHNLGLAVDLVSSDWYQNHSDLTTEFESTPAFAWLEANAARFGFVLRYQKGKESITGVEYEPWHYRYVGVTAATEMQKQQLVLEEYLSL